MPDTQKQASALRRALFAVLIVFISLGASTAVYSDSQPFGIVIHGGAGTITRAKLTPKKEKATRAKLDEAVSAGYSVLENGGKSLDAVIAAILVLENSPLFNAGAGAVYTADRRHELDSSLMDGASGNAGAAAGVSIVRNPILLARAVMEKSPHVMLSGTGADAFAREAGLELVDNDYFDTEFRLRQLERAQASEKAGVVVPPMTVESKFGTVGAVALDRHGDLAAGTSTGGTTNKRFGRIGDSPVIGAGTYASNESCAVSATGHGEYFIRQVVAYDICAQMQYTDKTLAESARDVVNDKLVKTGGDGGVIAIDREGNIATPFNTEGMYRAWRLAGGKTVVGIYNDDKIGGEP